MESSFSLFAISVWDLTFSIFASLSAFACAMATSFSASAFAMDADFRICSRLSMPRSSISPSLSLMFCTLKDRILIPSSAISPSAFAFTCSENSALFWQMSLRFIVPMISRRFPCKDFAIVDFTESCFLFRKFRMAISIPCSTSIDTCAIASTRILMKSCVGM